MDEVVVEDEKICCGSCRCPPCNVERRETSFILICKWAGGVANGNQAILTK